MCGKTYVKKKFHSQKSALGRYGSVCSVKFSNRFYNFFGITCVCKPQRRKIEKICGGKVYEKHYQIGLFGNDITHYGPKLLDVRIDQEK